MRQRTVRDNAAWMQRWAWAISLVMAVVGFGLNLPLAKHPFDPWWLIVLPLGWLGLFLIVRTSAKYLPRMLFPGEK